ncbi:MAG: DNA (cytosine-5-)-methyltransferase [Sarcina sp.]
MFKIVEAFSGIGSQAKALKNIGVDYEIIGTIDWDISAIIAYDIIHNGKPDLSYCDNKSIFTIKEELKSFTLSFNSKCPIEKKSIDRMNILTAKYLYSAIKRSKNLVSITDVKGNDLPEEIDLLTYSFPCQDLSIARAWHGENSGIDRGASNRSGMLWEVERILLERKLEKKSLPRFLLMENVSNIMSQRHAKNFEEWRNILEQMGYCNKYYNLNAIDFGIPQRRKRVFMISVLSENETIKTTIEEYLDKHDLSKPNFYSNIRKFINLEDILKLDYSNPIYRNEANLSQPNNTPSRVKIYKENKLLYDGEKILSNHVKTLTTKQDRNPNSGVINYNSGRMNKIDYRTLTPRECFLLMGFSEEDYQKIIDNNFKVNNSKYFFTQEKLYRMAGNSIVVNVLEAIFRQMLYIDKYIIKKN